MSLLGFSCNACGAADPTNDTVKVDMEAVIREQQVERETRERIEAEVRAAREAQDLEDQERIREIEAQRGREEEQEADARRSVEEQRRIAEEKFAELRQNKIEEVRIAQEAKERAAEEVAAQEAERNKRKIYKLLKEYGVAEVNQKKKSLMSFKYPLHYAVEKGDAEAVRLLLHFKADASSLNSSKKTALQLAEKAKMKDEIIMSMLRVA